MTADFAVFRCSIQAVTELPIKNQLGEAVQALFFQLLRRISPTLAEGLHDKSGHQVKAYAVSDLMDEEATIFRAGQGNRPLIQQGQVVWFQVVGLQASVVEALEAGLMQTPPAGVELDHNFWVLDTVQITQSTSINTLVMRHRQGIPPKQIDFTFQTPTSFKRKGQALPLPLPSLIFGTLRRRWEEITGLVLSPQLTVFTDYFVSIGNYALQSRPHYIQDTSHQAFTGTVTYAIHGGMAQLKKDCQKFPEAATLWQALKNDEGLHAELARALGLLADFAVYAGVGMKTTQGLGMVLANIK